MVDKLSVLVQIDLDGAYVRLVVTGCVTEASQLALHPLVRRVRAVLPSGAVSVDLTGAQHVEASAIDRLRRAVDHDVTVHSRNPVQVVAPEHLSAETRTPVRIDARSRHRRLHRGRPSRLSEHRHHSAPRY